MTDNRTLLDEQMGSPPPSTIDLEAIIARQRRRARLRQVGVGGSAVALAGAATLIATTLIGPGSGSKPAHQVAGGPAPKAHHRAAAPTTTAPAAGARGVEAARLTSVLKNLIGQALPDAQFSRSPLATALDEPAGGPLEFVDTGKYFIAMAEVTDAQGVSNIIVRVGRTDDALVQQHGCIGDPPPQDIQLNCDKVALGDGGYLVKMTTTRGKFQRDLAEVVRAGGNVVDVEIANSVHYYKAERPTLNLTLAQLTALAKNADLATTG